MNAFGSYPILEVLAFILWLLAIWPQWGSVKSEEKEAVERQLGYSAVRDAVQAGLTVSSIILAGMGVMIGLPSKGYSLGPDLKLQLTYVAVYSILVILLGAILFSLLPSRVRNHNPAYDKGIASLGIAQLILVVSGAIRFAVAILVVVGR